MKKEKKPTPISFIGFFVAFVLSFATAVSDGNVFRYIASFFFLMAGIIELVSWIKSKDKNKGNK